ncbi:MAG: S8 family serine peptidase [Candidatus Krumholzibacteriia bacterium]
MPRLRLVGPAPLVAIVLVLFVGCAGSPRSTDPAAASAAARVKVTSLDQLPQHTYPVSGTALELFEDDAAFAAFAAQVRQDLEADLARYELDDAATLKGWYDALANLALLDHRWDDALGYFARSRDLEVKEAARLTSGQVGEAVIAAFRQTGEQSLTPAVRQAFAADLARRVEAWPWDVVQDVVERRKGQAEYMAPNLLIGAVQMQFEPVVQQSGELGSDLARGLVALKVAQQLVLPLKAELAAVYTDYIAANAVEKRNIWPDRDEALPVGLDLAPVVIGIWDSGVDADVFGEAMVTNEGEAPDGLDNDGNGFVDDIHGIAFDREGRDTVDLLHPEEEQAGRVAELRLNARGLSDLQSNRDTAAAVRVRDLMASLAPEDMHDFMQGMSFFGLQAHGTHVTGIALAGNPYARALAARISFDYHNPPQPMTLEIARRHADSYRRTARYFTDHQVRVVNMSWGWTFKEIESSLESGGVGASAEERAALARGMLDVLADGLREAMATTPGILYCVAAGNSDSDVEFDVSIPASFGLPNMIVVGAVDQAGDPTDFTSGGEDVVVYANGFEVESTVPGGERMPMSGTSMASPQVCNLAGKLVAIRPELQPAQIIDLIERGADPHPDHPEILLLNPRRSLALARAEG